MDYIVLYFQQNSAMKNMLQECFMNETQKCCPISTCSNPNNNCIICFLYIHACILQQTESTIHVTQTILYKKNITHLPCLTSFGVRITRVNDRSAIPIRVRDSVEATCHHLCAKTRSVNLLLGTTDHTGFASNNRDATGHTTGLCDASDSMENSFP